MNSEFTGPVNIGSEEMIRINDLAKMVIDISGKQLAVNNIAGPVGVRGRNSDNKLYAEKIGWTPSQSLKTGIEKTYEWINKQVIKNKNQDYVSTAQLDIMDKFPGLRVV
jgi:nucleoside-diphosphate-sugar epimerase